MGFSTFQWLQNFISSIFFLRDLRPSFIAGLGEQSQFERLGNDLFMNILTNGADPEDVKFCCVGELMIAAIGPNVSSIVMTGSRKSGEATRLCEINESGMVTGVRRSGIDCLEGVNLITRCNYVKTSEFLIDVPARADEYYR